MKVIVCLVVCLFLSGCIQKEIVDEISLIQGIGYDLLDDEKILGTIVVPIYKAEPSTDVNVFTVTGETSKEIKSAANQESPQPLVSGQVRIALIGENFAKKGVQSIIDTLHRDPSIGNRMLLAVAKKDASSILSTDYKVGKRSPMYVSELINQNTDVENLPQSNLHMFLYSFYSDGRDPYLPLIEKKKDHVDVVGVALFKKDRFVKSISLREAYVLRVLTDEGFESGTFKVDLAAFEENENMDDQEGDHDIAMIENVRTKTKTEVVTKNEIPKFIINVKLKGIITEFTGEEKLDEKESINKIKKALKEKIEKESLQLIKELQKLKIDPIGLGEQYRSTTRKWDPKKWRDIYPNVDIDVHVTIEIVQSGVVE